MKRIFSKALILTLLFQLINPLSVTALTEEVKTRLAEANTEVRAILGIDADYYTPENRYGKPLNESYVTNGISSKEYPAFVYGTEEEASKEATGSNNKHLEDGEYRCYGYAKYGDMYTNPDFPADYAMQKYADTKTFIPKPWDKRDEIDLVRRILGDTPAFFDMDGLTKANQKPDHYRKSIAMGIGLQYGIYWDEKLKGISEEQLRKDIATLSQGYKGNMVNGKFLTLPWEEYCHIIQPPTERSWGAGVVFHTLPSGAARYFSVPLPPLDLTNNEDDLSVVPVSVPTEVGIHQPAEVILAVESTFKEPQDTVYKWEVLNATTGDQVENLTFSEKTLDPEGRMFVAPNPEDTHDDDSDEPIEEPKQYVKVNFDMPESDVIIRFRINNLVPDDPDEKNITNNLFTATITMLAPEWNEAAYNIDYNVLSREIEHPLADGADIGASVSGGKGSWTGNMTGHLDITKEDPKGYLQDYQVEILKGE